MKILYKHLSNEMISKPKIEDVSEKLFQLGHENEISNQTFDIEFTPNRGDCLSVDGLQRDLKQFYEISDDKHIYENEIPLFDFEFDNLAEKACKKISFMQIEIDKIPDAYEDYLDTYFIDLEVKKNNFFTDVSNYISYETGQPTHCYDLSKINGSISLEHTNKNYLFKTLLDKEIEIEKDTLAFFDKNKNVINLAGIIGGMDTACNSGTTSVIIECAYFEPEAIIGKSLKYGIHSDAAYKFERNVDFDCHERVLRRFLKIIEDHSTIKNVKLFTETYSQVNKVTIPFDTDKINSTLGTSIDEESCIKYLNNFGFEIKDKLILVPSYRSDILSQNDIAEEIARAVGYDNIDVKNFTIKIDKDLKINKEEEDIKSFLISNGFYEVINDPFVLSGNSKSIIVDNPLDSNRKFLRQNLTDSLIKNLLYNERRQKESIKLFEISDIYTSGTDCVKRVIGIIASGRVGKNYQDFSKKFDNKYFRNLLLGIENILEFKILDISRELLDSKSKNPILYVEIEINPTLLKDYSTRNIDLTNKKINLTEYVPISDFPSSNRDLSFSLKDYSKCKALEILLLNFEHDLLKEVFVFDYFKNEKLNEIKIGFRFIFQSDKKTITENEVNKVMDTIISSALALDKNISIPGL